MAERATATRDVIIVGAGPAGSALAIELASEGLDVLLVDAARFPRDKTCGDYVSPRGLARLDALGCGVQLRALGCTPIRRSRLYLDRDELVSGTLPDVAGLPRYGHAVPRLELDHILFQRAIEAGAATREEYRVTGLEHTARGVEIMGTLAGRPHREHGRIVIGADGATSVVARAAGLGMTDARYTLASMRAYAHGLTLDHTIMYFDHTYFPGYGWVFPVRPGLCNVGVGMVSESLGQGGLALPDFFARFRRLCTKLGRAHGTTLEIGPHRGWPIRTYGGARRNYFDRGLLIGEAGCLVDPMNGEGIPLALDSAHLAARTIRAAFRRGRFAAGDLAGYEADWRAAFDPDLAISDLIVSMIRNRRFLPLWLSALRMTSHVARHDPRYAAITGGILGGVVPARRALTPEMFLRTLALAPSYLREASRGRAAGWLSLGQGWLRGHVEFARALVEDGPGLVAWLREIEAKQRTVVRSGGSRAG